MSSSILIVEDDPPLRTILERVLQQRGHSATTVDSGAAALAEMRRRNFDVLITDLMMKPMDGLALLDQARARHFNGPVIFITANDDVQTALTAMRRGAFDYVVKPIRIPEFVETIGRALQFHEQQASVPALSPPPEGENVLGMVAASPAMRHVVETARRLALTNVPLLIVGEPGSGRTTVAHLIHEISHRRKGPYRAVDCAHENAGQLDALLEEIAKPANLFSGGTLTLDNIEGLSLSQQARLAQFLLGDAARAPSAPRMLATSDATLATRVTEGRFLAPLHQRLSLLTLALPPLRERREDRAPLAMEIARRIAGRYLAFDTAALSAVENYDWPGNVSQMVEAIADAVRQAGAGPVLLKHFPEPLRRPAPAGGAATKSTADLRGRWLVGFLKTRGVTVALPPPASEPAPRRPAERKSS